MSSGPHLRRTTSHTTRQALRLTLKPQAAAMGMIDGAWWPRSRDSLAEFPAMIAGIQWRLGRPDQVAYNSDAWTETPRHMVVDGHAVRLVGFRFLDENTVLVSGRGWHRMALLVIPPESAGRTAVKALARAANPENTEQAEEILIHSGIGAGPSDPHVPAPRTPAAETSTP
ncbi:DUF5994 family protein [Amycolatopsis sp. GM8]|uniref:DUF5994 family protein n=1 Tax=Amycolatopsis sp. GM8 TaxID=2896530 RepID=UPI001F3B78DB|nr:DUF5994 family protein [Amycolatopsis sp. GM8]